MKSIEITASSNYSTSIRRNRSKIKALNSQSDKSEIKSSISLFENLENEQLLTAEELAKRLHIAVKTVRKWRYENVLPSDSMVKLRHQVRYRWGKVLGWLCAKGKQ